MEMVNLQDENMAFDGLSCTDHRSFGHVEDFDHTQK